MIRVSLQREEVHLSVYQVLKPVSSKAACTYLCHFLLVEHFRVLVAIVSIADEEYLLCVLRESSCVRFCSRL
jgi:hypothetical protein